MPGICRSQKRALHPPELELRTVVSCSVNAENQIQVFNESNVYGLLEFSVFKLHDLFIVHYFTQRLEDNS